MAATTGKTKKLSEKDIVRKWFPLLLKTDPDFREEVMGQLTGVLATKDDIAKILSKLEEHSRILEEHSRILEEHSRILEGHSKRIEDLVRRMDKFDKTLSAVGARWGVLAEEAFREGMVGILKDLGFTVKKWRIRDEEGIVFGRASMVEADILIKNGTHLLIEIKSSVSKFDVAGSRRIGELYEKREGVKPKVVIISPFVDSRAAALADDMGIEYYSTPEEVAL